jgi:hypothetical protein
MPDAKQSSPGNANQPTGKDQSAKIGKDKNVEFERLKKSDLKSVPVFVQALDNEWLPRDLLKEAQKKGRITPNVGRTLRKTVRAEYIHSLINGEQVVLNRAYLYNNPAISQDYAKRKSLEYQAFKALLEEKTIIPYLLTEESPTDKPIFDLQEQAFARWIELCQEIRTSCIRLSWDTKVNKKLQDRHLDRRFHQFVVGAAAGDIDTYMQDLKLDLEAKASLRKMLVQMGQLCLELNGQGKLVTRDILYKQFVTASNTPTERRYDSSPLAGAIKQLLDLSYNSNLPDALGGYLITPVDSLPRTALQEWQREVQRPTITAKDLLALLQRTVFGLVQPGLNVPSMDILQLSDVRAIRATEEWALYIQSLQALLNHPEQFADGLAGGVYQSYAALAQHITSRINQQSGKGSLLTLWKPAIELVFNIVGGILSYRLTEQGPQWRLRGKVAELVAGDTAPVVGKFVIRDLAEEHPQQDLSTGIDFLHFQIPDVQEQWKEIEMQVRKFPGFQELAEEREVVDPTISYKEIQ